MKKLLLLLLFCFGINGMAQTITFEYDLAGNQIKRTYNAIANRINDKETKEYEDLVENDLQKFFPEDVISYYPNPVKDEFYLKWELHEDKKVTSIDVYNISGQLIERRSTIIENSTIISFGNFTSGTYLVNLNYNNGVQKSITIIKN
ncbi:T9SS type A sorting domain-containing protein [Flavobacterium sp.]|uniref:T9SS type A sorting domain-containing protein n=1 Tax=Flavobacterium sp. TaxID=239 RepID=UPI00333F8FB0